MYDEQERIEPERLWESVRDVLAYEGSDFPQLEFCSIEITGLGIYTIRAPSFAIAVVNRLTEEIEIILYQLTQELVYGVRIEEVPITSYQERLVAEVLIL